MSTHEGRWQVEQVLALAPKPSSVAAAQPLAVSTRWVSTGCTAHAVWGRCTGTSAEPYECVVDHEAVAFRCSCPSRALPCKHALALLLLWARGLVAEQTTPPPFAATWLAGRVAAPAVATPSAPPAPAAEGGAGAVPAPAAATPAGAPPESPAPGRDDRVARMAAGLAELDRWLDDRLRTGLADPALARYDTWDDLAARLVDAQVGGLANRVRRMAGMVGAHPQWHEHVLAELGALHLLAVAGRTLGSLPPGLADSVAAAIGWQVRQADVLAGLPHTDQWVVMGRSDTREDRIEVRRIWLRGRAGGRWAMVLSFAAYGQSLDSSLPVGAQVHADVFRYPGALGLRCLVGRRHDEPGSAGVASMVAGDTPVVGCTIAEACAQIGSAVAAEPWVDRYPVCVQAAPARVGARWVLTDRTGSVPLAEGVTGVGALLSCSEGRPVVVVAEWTPAGLIPLALHLPDRAIDIGPTADASFLAAGA
ncbi:MAG: SWIM zinc finger family protein [Actinomycetota bacterium]|nr:SWIM zinc finger family protein [Actinomycetota bacterium]